VPPSFSRLNC